MSSVTTSLSDSLTSVPKLLSSGKNFTMFSERFKIGVDAKGFWGHFDGTTPCPPETVAATSGDVADASEASPNPAYTQWRKDEAAARALLTQKLPDTALVLVLGAANVKLCWDAIVKEYSKKGVYAMAGMRRKFMDSRCGDKEDVQEFLEQLRVRREELAACGVTIDDEEYLMVVVSSVPRHLQSFASTICSANRVAGNDLDPNYLIQLIIDEHSRQDLERNARRGKRQNKDHDTDEALSATGGSNRGRGKGKEKGKKQGGCFKCGSKDHWKKDCPEKKKLKDDAAEGKGKGKAAEKSTANAVETDSEDEGAFAVDFETDDELPILLDCSDSSDSECESVLSCYPQSENELDLETESDWWPSEDEFESPHHDAASVDFGSESDASDFELEGLCNQYPLKAEHAGIDETDDEQTLAAVEAGADDTHSERSELYDSGCTKHLTPYKDEMLEYRSIVPKVMRAANKQSFKAVGAGKLVLNVPNGTDSSKLCLTEVLYSPEIGHTLVSIGKLDDLGFITTFGGGKCTITSPEGETIGEIPKTRGGLYRLIREGGSAYAASDGISLDMLHRRLGHISPRTAKRLVKSGLVSGLTLDDSGGDDFFCESCVYAKATRKSVPRVREGERGKNFGDEIHSDVWGPARVETPKGKKYYVTFTDDATRFTHLHLMRTKDEVFTHYKTFEAWAATQLDARVKVLHSDRGGEYTGKEFTAYLKEQGINQKLTIHDTPQENGVAERRNRTIVERVRAVLHASDLPRTLWGEAARHVVWLMNRTSTKALDGGTPYEAVFKKKPDLSEIREWGETAWVRVEGDGDKLKGRAKKGRWIGIDEASKGHRIYWPDSRRVSVERNVYFDDSPATSRVEGENESGGVAPIVINSESATPDAQERPKSPTVPPPDPLKACKPRIDEPVNMPETPQHSEAEASQSEAPVTPAAPKRLRKASQRAQDLLDGKGTYAYRRNAPKLPPGVPKPDPKPDPPEKEVYEGEGSAAWMMEVEEEIAMVVEMSSVEGLEPQSYHEAKRRPDWSLWEASMREEVDTLTKAGTWRLVVPPPGANIVGSRWVFRIKKDAGGNVVQRKSRVVAQGFSQVPGIDYFDTFAPVAKTASIRTVLAVAAANDWELHQIDVKGAYLNGRLNEDEQIYMKQPPGFHAPHSEGKVCRLVKAIYGLKQAGRRWYQTLCDIMVHKLGFTRCDVDQAVFFRRAKSTGETIIVLVHVDDCTIAATSMKLVTAFKSSFTRHVEIKDLGELHWLLGIEIRRERENRKLFMSQRSYIDSMVERYLSKDVKPLSLPLDPNLRLTSAHSPTTAQEYAKMRGKPYQELVGSLMYASLGTRPDIAFAVQTLSRFTKNPGIAHWEEAVRCLRYLKGTRELWLTFGGGKRELLGYGDADGSMAEDRHAISGYAFILHGGAVSWSAKRQEIIALSTTEAEYVAATHAAKEALWLRSLITQLFDTKLPPTTLFSDNQSAIALSKDHQYHARTKHIDVRFHFIRYTIERGSLRLVYCPTDDMVADTLTKALPSAKVKHFASELGLSLV